MGLVLEIEFHIPRAGLVLRSQWYAYKTEAAELFVDENWARKELIFTVNFYADILAKATPPNVVLFDFWQGIAKMNSFL